MDRDQLKAAVFARVMRKLEAGGYLRLVQRPGSVTEAAAALAQYMDPGDVGYLNKRGQFVLECSGDYSAEAMRRVGLVARQIIHGARESGIELHQDLAPCVFRTDTGFTAAATYNIRLREAALSWTPNPARTLFRANMGEYAFTVFKVGATPSWGAGVSMPGRGDHPIGNGHPSKEAAMQACENWMTQH